MTGRRRSGERKAKEDSMPQYMLLIYSPVGGPPSEEQAEPLSAWYDYSESLRQAGVLVDANPLQGVDTATTVRVRDGETQVTDGPFAETTELLAGYYLLDCPDLDTALAHAARVPNIHYGSTEVRPVMEVPSAPSEQGAQARA
jgi:hypothetical protein